jgi:anti-anti-sigma factor
MNTGQIYYAVIDGRGVLKLTGTVRHPLSERLAQAARLVFTGAEVRSVIVDLTEAQFIDSTCLGLLARVGMRCLEIGLEPPILVSAHEQVTLLIKTTGLDRAFVLLDNPTGPVAAMVDAASLADLVRRPDPRLVLDAHRALCELNQKNRHLFQSVVDVLETEVSAQDWIDPALHAVTERPPPRSEARGTS